MEEERIKELGIIENYLKNAALRRKINEGALISVDGLLVLNSKDEKIKLERGKDKAYEKYAAGHMTADKYMSVSEDSEKKAKSLSRKIDDVNDKLNQIEEEYYKDAKDLKQVIRYSHIEKLTQEVVDTFIQSIYVYHDKSIEIEWKFTEHSVGQS